jgi:NAD-dependent deacetylase
VDDLHERAGSSTVLHVHGSLFRVKEDILDNTGSHFSIVWDKDLQLGDTSDRGIQLRPDIVWFGEFINHYMDCEKAVKEADYVILIGTSLNVYPFSRLPLLKKPDAIGVYIDPEIEYDVYNYFLIEMTAVAGMELLYEILDELPSHPSNGITEYNGIKHD